MGMTKTTWVRMRKNPENLNLYDLVRMSQFLDVPFTQLVSETIRVVEEKQKNGTLSAARFRKS